ncbi:PD-(D/E)XK nuclease family transposase [Tepidibacter sp. Z1-5]|uniref:PD-(D/E)XK nuclease family transposase n=1 Tax=Tepidibacter sp. Z1-5 TaxID=3134138 RepID=UPI0030C3911F
MIKGLLDPKIDFVFKNIFGSSKHPKILISFLNAILKPKHLIKGVEIQNTDLEKHFVEDKFSRLDVKATTSNDDEQRIIYEMRSKILKDKVSALSKAKNDGIKQGIQQEKIETAKNLLKLGMDISLVKEATKLSEEEIIKLKEILKK